MHDNFNQFVAENARKIGSYTRNAVKAFEEGIVNEENFLEKVDQKLED